MEIWDVSGDCRASLFTVVFGSWEQICTVSKGANPLLHPEQNLLRFQFYNNYFFAPGVSKQAAKECVPIVSLSGSSTLRVHLSTLLRSVRLELSLFVLSGLGKCSRLLDFASAGAPGHGAVQFFLDAAVGVGFYYYFFL